MGFHTKFKAITHSGDKPSMMVIAAVPRILDTLRLLNHARWHFNVSSLRHAAEFGTYPDRIANVFEEVRAGDEVKSLVLERPWSPHTKIPGDPGFGREAPPNVTQ